MIEGRLFVISGPSGAGKSTLIHELLNCAGSVFSISATTRPPREGERDGEDYLFITRAEFERMIQNGELLEHAEYAGNYYGTPRTFVEEKLGQGFDVLLDIEICGAMQVREKLPEAVLVFIAPPSMSELEARLRLRATESGDRILKRLEIARRECAEAYKYDYLVVNGDLGEALYELRSIIAAEKCRYFNRKHIIERM